MGLMCHNRYGAFPRTIWNRAGYLAWVLAALFSLPAEAAEAPESAEAPGGTIAVASPQVGELLNVPLERYAYRPGESFHYRLSWGGVTAGKSSISIAEGTAVDGSPVWNIVSTAESSDFISVFYPVRDHIVSQLDPQTHLPRRIEIDQRHGKRKRVRTTVFDRVGQSATTFQAGRDPVTSAVPPRVHDILSCLFYFRSLPGLEPGQTRVIDVHEGKKNWRLLIHVEERERVEVPAGAYDTLRIRAEVRFRGVFYDRGDVHLWLTDDANRVPVKVRVKIQIGSVISDLTRVTLPPVEDTVPPGGGPAGSTVQVPRP
ncbi:MAG: DUF3108 domain-containing protein [Nitrospirota bacterium]|nr:DUF3108 domain-containing protein [Nitrospirota bacterium]